MRATTTSFDSSKAGLVTARSTASSHGAPLLTTASGLRPERVVRRPRALQVLLSSCRRPRDCHATTPGCYANRTRTHLIKSLAEGRRGGFPSIFLCALQGPGGSRSDPDAVNSPGPTVCCALCRICCPSRCFLAPAFALGACIVCTLFFFYRTLSTLVSRVGCQTKIEACRRTSLPLAEPPR